MRICSIKNIWSKCRKPLLGTSLLFTALLLPLLFSPIAVSATFPTAGSTTCVPMAGDSSASVLADAQPSERINKVNFTFIATDGKGNNIYNESGFITLSDNKFRIEVQDDLIMVSDGEALWVYKPQSEDIIIMENSMKKMPAMQASSSLTSDSALDKPLEEALRELAALFGFSESSPGDSGKAGRASSSNSSAIKIERNTSGQLLQIEFNSKDNSKYIVKVKSIEPIKESDIDPQYFTILPENYPNAIVTDLR